MSELPPAPDLRQRRRRRQQARIVTYVVVGSAAYWFITHPSPFPTAPAPVVTSADTLAADSTVRDSVRARDTVPRPLVVPRLPRLPLPASVVPNRTLFRSVEVRARAGERIAVSVTAYCLQGRTRRGNLVRDGIIAVDRKLFPLGREVDLFFGRRKYGRFLADDTGGVIKGGRIDVWMSDCAAARRFGRRRGYAQLVRPDA
ncbi:MAG: 3D domain-containing protein [Gemmatimonadota bacterium]